MQKRILLLACATTFLSTANFAQAQDGHHHHGHHHGHHHVSHAGHHHSGLLNSPISIMGDHLHEKGGFMLSARTMHMKMDGNQIGSSNVDADTIVTTVSNRFANVAGQPPTLRVVPTEMTMKMHMLGAMYGVTDWLTVMAMANYIEKDMDHITYMGMAGTTVRGTFQTESEGWGDTKLAGLVQLFEGDSHSMHLNLGLSLPTGSIEENGQVLAPNGMTPTLRLPYAMQLGTGTYDLHPGVTYTSFHGDWSWGAQYTAEIRLEDENDEGYSWGDKHGINLWAGYQWSPIFGSTVRFSAAHQDDIDGIDSRIVAPVQTADPDNYGGTSYDIGVGFNLEPGEGHRIGFEVGIPVYQDLNGPQMERDWAFTAGWQWSF